jgi:hypothetical protein
MKSRCKYRYAEDDVPEHCKGLKRPARFDLRLTCSDRARLLAVLSAFRKEYFADATDDVTYATIVAERVLPVLEHHIRTIRIGDTATARFIRAQAEPIPKRDHLRSIFKRLKERFEPKQKESEAK